MSRLAGKLRWIKIYKFSLILKNYLLDLLCFTSIILYVMFSEGNYFWIRYASVLSLSYFSDDPDELQRY